MHQSELNNTFQGKKKLTYEKLISVPKSAVYMNSLQCSVMLQMHLTFPLMIN